MIFQSRLIGVLLVCVLLLNVLNLYGQAESSLSSFYPEKTVELAVFFDQYLYHHWLSLLTRKTQIHQFMRSYLDVLLESLNIIYAHPSLFNPEVPQPLIRFHLRHTQLFWRDDPSNLNKSTRASASSYLETFCDFANRKNNGSWDHALLLTGVDLKFPQGENYGVAGISWQNSICNDTYSCSIVEGKTFRSVMTAAHEIGHSLGIEHDGLKHNLKCPPRGYIMSHAGHTGDESAGVEKIMWSRCSRHNLRAFLVTAPNVLSNQVACLNNLPERSKNGFKEGRSLFRDYGDGNNDDNSDEDEGGKLVPGIEFSVEHQCQMAGGMRWKPSTRKNHVNKFCSMLHCNNTITRKVVPFHPALEGTPCGINKVCKFGECVQKTKHRRTGSRA